MKVLESVQTGDFVDWGEQKRVPVRWDRRAGRAGAEVLRGVLLAPVVLCLAAAWLLAALLSAMWIVLAFASRRPPGQWHE